jgi:flagellin-like protein
MKNKRALSPVIATVILVSVTIVVAVSVAYWMGTIAGGYTAYEQIELPTAYALWDSSLFSSAGGWNVTIELKNTGSADATIDNMFLNAIPISTYTSGTVTLYNGGTLVTDLSSIAISVTKGSSASLLLQVQRYNSTDSSGVAGCTSGTRVDLKLHTAAGREYPVQVKLP